MKPVKSHLFRGGVDEGEEVPVLWTADEEERQDERREQRWRCGSCGARSTHRNDVTARELKSFLSWHLGKGSQLDMAGQDRSFRRTAARFWPVCPMPDIVDEVHRVVFVDGIYLECDLCVLVACIEEHVLSWVLVSSEGTLFAYLEAALIVERPLLLTNNVICGGDRLAPRRHVHPY